jgi:hypothetical protein
MTAHTLGDNQEQKYNVIIPYYGTPHLIYIFLFSCQKPTMFHIDNVKQAYMIWTILLLAAFLIFSLPSLYSGSRFLDFLDF